VPRNALALVTFVVATALVFGLDLALAAPVTGILAIPLMLAALGLLVRKIVGASGESFGLGALRRFELILAVVALGFVAARGYVVYHDLADAAGTNDPLASAEAARTYDGIFGALALAIVGLAFSGRRALALMLRAARHPGLLFAGSFGAMIVVGTLLLTLPFAVRSVTDVSLLDALFTITSAVCVTGLAVNDVGATYTPFGQLVILLGIQVGAVGLMTLAALAVTMSRDPSLRSQLRYAQMLDVRTLDQLRVQVRTMLIGTLVIEAIGALGLGMLWAADGRLEGRSVVWMSVFHAVSAFCNAGFSLFPRGMATFVDRPGVQGVLMVLITLGGLGFPVILELCRHGWGRFLWRTGRGARPPELSLLTRVAVKMSAALVVVGTLAIYVLEVGQSLEPLGLGERLYAALFASVNTRTAGFNSVDVGAMRDATLLVTCGLMLIGGSPSSTAGGIKTTTAAVFLAALRGELRGHEPTLAGRSLPPELLRRATAVVSLSVMIVGAVILLLTLTEDQPFIALAFEAVSAFATVGLSVGITGSLSAAGKCIIATAMFLGRVGPLTIALAVGQQRDRRPFRLAPESLPIG